MSFDGTIMDTVIQHAKNAALINPMMGKPTLEYYHMVETYLCNCVIATVQHLDLELKIFEVNTRLLKHYLMITRPVIAD